MRIRRRAMRIFWLVAGGLALSAPLQPQRSAPVRTGLSTAERLETEPWWPTKSNSRLAAYAGSDRCQQCHEEGAAGPTAMQLAASRPGAERQAGGKPATFISGAYRYSLQSDGAALRYSVASGVGAYTQQPAWIVGAGELARTYLYETEGHWYQSQVSLYTQAAALDVTTGFGPSTGPALEAALGNQLSPREARACFACHTVHATSSAGLNPLHAEPGVGCEACHGPGAAHAAGQRTAGPTPEQPAIFNPATLSPADSIDFCGACHRSFADANLATGQGTGTAVVRFQPYRLEESRCWRATEDKRLTCVACHDPHQPLERRATAYDATCQSCHSAAATHSAATTHNPEATQVANAGQDAMPAAKVCPRATANCVTCHMPKVQIASMHGSFTDHDIRVDRPGSPLPR